MFNRNCHHDSYGQKGCFIRPFSDHARIVKEFKETQKWVQACGKMYLTWEPFFTLYNTGRNLFLSVDNSPCRPFFVRSIKWYWLPFKQWNSSMNPRGDTRSLLKKTLVTIDHHGHLSGVLRVTLKEAKWGWRARHPVQIAPGELLHVIDTPDEGIFWKNQFNPLPMMYPSFAPGTSRPAYFL